jgi:putative intracellular protease/amidase
MSNVKIVPDVALSAVKGNSYDAIVLPGGIKSAESMIKVKYQINLF